MKGKEEWFKICPQCESKNITIDVSTESFHFYKCKNCGFFGPLFPEVKEKG
jgi:predicted RNA-binding Zn-ribbon protein involved in translation (DUF1610 family)